MYYVNAQGLRNTYYVIDLFLPVEFEQTRFSIDIDNFSTCIVAQLIQTGLDCILTNGEMSWKIWDN